MARIKLTLYIAPGEAETFVNIRCADGSYQRVATTIDTGAELSLFDTNLLQKTECREKQKVSIEQAGIAHQSFDAIEAYIKLFLEDADGLKTKEFEILALFAETEANLLGFEGVLDQSTLYIDMCLSRTGWIEIDD
jgi:hypothetical protein